jgi:cysteine desulfurase
MPNNPGASCIYLDNHATTPLDPRVFEKIKPFFLHSFGNPASAHHRYGWEAHDAVNQARSVIAEAINAHPTEIIFTSGASEATNLALKGLFLPVPTQSEKHIISSSIEHRATLSSIEALKSCGVSATLLRPVRAGHICSDDLRVALERDPPAAVVSLFLVNHEIGSINNIRALASIIKKSGALFHCDATQALGRVAINCQELDFDMMSFSGHKIYGPKGVGVLYIRKEILHRVCPLIHGGGQEWQKRSGTLNVPGIVGLGEAVRLAVAQMPEEVARIELLRDRLLNNLNQLDNIYINGSMKNRIAGNLNISFGGIDGEELILSICQQVAISTGSACASSNSEKSSVLAELGVIPALRQATLRFGVGRFNTVQEIDRVSEIIITQVKKQRNKTSTSKILKLGRRDTR